VYGGRSRIRAVHRQLRFLSQRDQLSRREDEFTDRCNTLLNFELSD
jgi:hypothetical protein